MAVEIAPRSWCITLVYSLAHANSAISAGFIGWISTTVLPSSSIATFVASQRFPRNGEVTYGPRSGLACGPLGWSSEKWSKASGRATLGLDQVRARLSFQDVDPT